MKTKDQNVPTAAAIFAGGAGILVMVVVGVILDKYFDLGPWVPFIGGMAWAVVFVGIIRLRLGRVPLRPWVLRLLGREN